METKSFKTKTMIIDRNNGQIAGVYPVALDIGYSSVKIFCPNKTACFPSFAKKYVNKGMIGEIPSDFISYTDLETGDSWLVGNSAQIDISGNEAIESDEALYGRQRYYDPMFRVISSAGLGIALTANRHGSIGKRKLIVQTGLPPKYTRDSDALRDVLSGRHHFSLRLGNSAPQEFDFTLSPEDISIMMQPMGTFFSAIKDDKNRYISDINNLISKNILIFDAGFGTFDLFLIKNHAVKDSQTFSDLGMKRVFQETIDGIRKEMGEDLSVSDMQKYLETGEIKIFDRKLFKSSYKPYGHLLEQASEKICRQAIERTAQIYPLNEIDCLVITGGTGAAWEREIRKTFSEMDTLKILSGNQNDTSLPFIFANVRGYYMYRCSALEDTFGQMKFEEAEDRLCG